jgi:hypothetical protein
VHFINNKYEAVLRLIGLPELPGHRKTGVGELFFYYFKYSYNTSIIVTGLAGLQHQGLESEYIGESKATELRG